MNDIVTRLRNWDIVSNHEDDVEKAADMLEFLLGQFKSYSMDMGGQHSWRFCNGAWPMTHLKGSNIEVAIDNVLAEVDREKSCNKNVSKGV